MLKGKHSDFEGMVADGGRWGEEEVDAKTLGYKVLSMQVEKTCSVPFGYKVEDPCFLLGCDMMI
jgi:hypothetical protein